MDGSQHSAGDIDTVMARLLGRMTASYSGRPGPLASRARVRAAKNAEISDSSQILARAPIFTGLGNRPALISSYIHARDMPRRAITSGSRKPLSTVAAAIRHLPLFAFANR